MVVGICQYITQSVPTTIKHSFALLYWDGDEIVRKRMSPHSEIDCTRYLNVSEFKRKAATNTFKLELIYE